VKLLLDMNLPPIWSQALLRVGHEAIHWSTVGPVGAPDAAILRWGREHGQVLVTHDLDYGALLAASRDSGPSVIILRTQGASTPAVFELLTRVITEHRAELEAGALLIADQGRSRVRILPI
jgi:predicted nuclease of predicted toxin-antitoxin system